MNSNVNLNFKAYQIGSYLKTSILRKVPFSLVPVRKKLTGELEVSITTYIDRYEDYFKPLYQNLTKLFPDLTIHVAVNGFFDEDQQTEFLKKIEAELCRNLKKGNTFILHDKPVGLTRLWNELINQGNCETVLILNDDLCIYPWFRRWVEKSEWQAPITLINGTWSHFFYSKSLIQEVGWFDEEFRGIGFEDMDYTARCASKGISINNLRCTYIKHQDHQPTRTSFDNESKTLWGPKYSVINHDAFFKKWKLCDHNSGIFIKQLNSYVEPTGKITDGVVDRNLAFTNGILYPDR